MYITKPHFRQETGRVLPKSSAEFRVNTISALRIREKNHTFAAKTQRIILQIQKNPA